MDYEELDIPVLEGGFLHVDSTIHNVQDESVKSVLCAFRDLCSIVWMLFTRDKLTLALRRKWQLLQINVSEL